MNFLEPLDDPREMLKVVKDYYAKYPAYSHSAVVQLVICMTEAIMNQIDRKIPHDTQRTDERANQPSCE